MLPEPSPIAREIHAAIRAEHADCSLEYCALRILWEEDVQRILVEFARRLAPGLVPGSAPPPPAEEPAPRPAAMPHLVDAAAPAMRKLLRKVAGGHLTPDEAVDVLLDWPDRAVGQGKVCALCGHAMTMETCGSGSASGVPLCHTDDHDCYHRWTVYGERPHADPNHPDPIPQIREDTK